MLHIFFNIFRLLSPEILITAIADLPVGVDKAYIVSLYLDIFGQ